MVLLIALGLALPVVFSGAIFRNRKAVLFAALIMGGVGIATGNPAFILADFFGVAVGYFIGIQFTPKKD